MGGAVKAVGDAFSGIGRAVSSIVQGAGKVISGVVKAIGNDPITFIAKAAAIATGNAWAIPLIDGVSTLAHGGSIGDALKVGASSAIASWATGGFGGEGLGIAQAVGGGTLGQIANAAAQGAISTGIRTGNIEQALIAGVTSAASAGIGAGVSSLGLGDALGAVGVGAVGTQLLSGAATGAIKAAVTGKDAAAGAGAGLASGLFNWGSKAVGDIVQNAEDFFKGYGADDTLLAQNSEVGNLGTELQQISQDYSQTQEQLREQNTQFEEAAAEYNSAMAPHQTKLAEAQAPYDEVKSQLQAKIDAYDAVRAEYDAAYAAKDGARVTALGDQLNALAEEANTFNETAFVPARDQYQAVVDEFNGYHEQNAESYDNAMGLRETAQEQADKLTQLQGRATEVSEQFNTRAEELQKQAEELQVQKELEALQEVNARAEESRTTEGGTDWGRLFKSVGSAALGMKAPAGSAPPRTANRTAIPRAGTRPATSATNASSGIASSVLPAIASAGIALGGVGAANANQDVLPPAQSIEQQQQANVDKGYDLFGFLKGGTKLINVPGMTAPAQQNMTYGQNVLPPAGTTPSSGQSVSEWFDNPFGDERPNADEQPNDGGLDQPYAHGGPVFLSEGGMRHVQGEGDGTSDSIEALLSSGEYVLSSDVVSALGNGDNEAGAKKLDEFVKAIRAHKQENGTELPPDALPPAHYLKEGV